MSTTHERATAPSAPPHTPKTAHEDRSGGIDPRGPQVAAGLTAVVLALVLLVAPHPVGIGLLAVQTAIFAVGAVAGVQRTPYSWLFRTLVRPRLGPPAELEDPAPPRFAQAVGLAFALVGLLALLAGATVLGQVAVGLALVAALLNAVFAFCLGCELYLLARRLIGGPSVSTPR
ncbi:DUF4395 domain-containing protein [Nocardioides sediminis]|uniref:DUF4395 domain-containing protein n=1 Tax=Nocardioides sediminis TaxID=433648 RepID=UPI000D320329|nr:DUF4395 domain-containing protein [Nocardioides sediminis]